MSSATYPLLVTALLVLLAQGAHVMTNVTYTCYLIDRYCWGLPDHTGLDGAKLDVAPQNHKVRFEI
jgi:hypothetical protein